MLQAFVFLILPLAVIYCSKNGASDKSKETASSSNRQTAPVDKPSPASAEKAPRKQMLQKEHLSAMDAHMDTSHEACGPRKVAEEPKESKEKAKGGSDEEKKEQKEEEQKQQTKGSKVEAKPKEAKKSTEMTKSCEKVTKEVKTKETMASPNQSRADGSISARPKSDEWFSKKQTAAKQKSDNADETQLPTTQTGTG